jgi:uncharacterized membrane protein YphA (DoxX/SURF4 family)
MIRTMKKYINLFQISRLAIAIILLQTLFFKFTGAEESKFIFSSLGVEPFGRYAVGTFEFIASLLLFVPGFSWLGALVAFGLMAGALGAHVFVLGIAVKGDGGLLFFLALAVLILSLAILWLKQKELIQFVRRYV